MRLAIFLTLPLLVACESPVPLKMDPNAIRIASLAEVTGCRPTEVITTTTGVFGTIGQARAMELARNETIQNALRSGANTMVYENGAPGSPDVFVRARAFVC